MISRENMLIVADENIPLAETLFSPYGEVRQLRGRALGGEVIADADVLLVRSVTRVDEALLKDSNVKFVGSATIGTDHVDTEYLKQQGITFVSAPGCNAVAVMNYVLASLSCVEPDWQSKTVGIVGCGNVGRNVYQAMHRLGVNCLCYDPFLKADQQANLCDFDELLQAQILCLHTPLTTTGPYPTHYMFDRELLASLKAGALILNAGRGAVVDNQALKSELACGRLKAILDVWEHEPNIDGALLDLVDLGTPHIAGYSLEGRIRGTTMVYEGFCRWLGDSPRLLNVAHLADEYDRRASPVVYQPDLPDDPAAMIRQVLMAYNPREDHQRLLSISSSETGLGEGFDRLRRDYPLRREFYIEG